MGATATLPPELDRFNLGACALGGIWAIFNNAYLGLLWFVPGIGLVMAVILGVKGNEWAWQNRRWQSVEHFIETQKVWTKAGIRFLWVCAAIILVDIVISMTTGIPATSP